MFAKLKKKIETEGGTLSSNDGSRPRRSESITSLPGAGNSILSPQGKDLNSPPASVTSEDPSMRDVTSARDDVVALLHKKTEQCRKMEGNISDLAALIKDKSKTIEKLEASLKQQDENLTKKLQEQKEEFEAYRDKLVEGYQQDKLKLDQLLNTEQELGKSQSELEAKTRQCQAAQVQVEKLTDEMGPLKEQLAQATVDNQRLQEENRERAELVTMLSKEKAAFDKRLDEMNLELTQKQSQNNSLQAKLANLDETHKTLQRNSDLQHNKSSKALAEKDDAIDALRERVATLEQRVADSALSGEDKTSAVEAERNQMEAKLAEARQQLTEIKSTWSDKITHLEDQISHLNTKIAEDGEEIASHQKVTQQMRDSFEKQIEGLKKQLEDAEKRALENFELASTKESHYEKQLMDLESKLQHESRLAQKAESQSQSETKQLHQQLSQLKDAALKSEEQAKDRISELEKRETELETQLKNHELNVKDLQVSLSQKEEEVTSLSKKVREKEAAGVGHNSTISSLESQIKDLEESKEKAVKERDEFEKHLRNSENEKVGLLERNADLYQQMEMLRKSELDCQQEHQRTLTLKAEGDTSWQKNEQILRQKIEALETQIEQSELSKVESGLYSSRIEEMEDSIKALEDQVSDKNRTIKKQEQMLKDLRVTLQRELKVQALPGDDINSGDLNSNAASYSSSSSSSPSSNRRTLDKSSKSDSLQTSASFPSLPSSGRVPPSHNPHSNHSNNYSNSSHHTSKGSSASPAVLSMDTMPPNFYTPSGGSSTPSGAGVDSLTVHTNNVKRELEKDVNFQYLKHVVLKFMLSREAEALQLIKAVSMLLNFSTQEQQLMKETLEWKMSWFGARPPGSGKGQTSKR